MPALGGTTTPEKQEKKKNYRKNKTTKRHIHKNVTKVSSSLCVSLCHTHLLKGTGRRGWTRTSNVGSFVTYSPQRVGLLPPDAQQVGCGWTELS